jgi:hypothetical protein
MRVFWLSLIGLALATPLSAQCRTSAIAPRINVLDCGVASNAAVDQTSALQAAIDASCAFANASTAPPPVYIPAGRYPFVSLTIRCSGLLLYGDGTGGKGGGRGGTQLCSGRSTEPMLTVGTPQAPVSRVTLQDFSCLDIADRPSLQVDSRLRVSTVISTA